MKGRVAIITGAGRGLGRTYARYFAARGATVIINTRGKPTGSADSAEAVAEEIRHRGGSAAAFPGDVQDPEMGERLLAFALEHYGRCDILLNNAGVPEANPFHKQTLEEFRAVFDPNFFGTLNVTRPIYRQMRERGYGRIVVSTSAAGLHGVRGMPAYSASKAALIGLMRAIALEAGTRNLRCNALAPYAATGMTDGYLPASIRPLLDPAFVAPVAAWLCGENCATSGEVFVVGGGRICRAVTLEGPVLAFDPPESLTPEAIGQNLDLIRSLQEMRLPTDGNDAFGMFLKLDNGGG